jgi:signal transduction histidine kinase
LGDNYEEQTIEGLRSHIRRLEAMLRASHSTINEMRRVIDGLRKSKTEAMGMRTLSEQIEKYYEPGGL